MLGVQCHEIASPEHIWQGEGSLLALPGCLARWKVQQPLLVIDPAVRSAPFGRRAARLAAEGRRKVEVWDQISPNAPLTQVVQAAEMFRCVGADAIVAVGGGSTIDLAKAVAAMRAANLPIEDLLDGALIPPLIPPLIAVPTTCGTGSETSPFAVILDSGHLRKRALTSPNLVPRDVILDVDALETLPPALVATTALDAMCHAMEAYVSRNSSHLTRCASLGAFLVACESIEGAVRTHNRDDLAALLAASTSARLLYPRTGLTVAHAMSHPLGALLGIQHGEAVARALLPSVRYNVREAPRLFARLGRYVGAAGSEATDTGAAAALCGWLEGLLNRIGLEYGKISAVGAVDGLLGRLVGDTMQSSNIASNPRPVTSCEVAELFEEVVAIE